MISDDRQVLQALGTPPTTPGNTAPQIFVSVPNAFNIATNQQVVFQGNLVDNDLTDAVLTALIDNSVSVPVTIQGNGTFTFTTNFNLNNVAGDNHTVEFIITDRGGLSSQTAEFSILIDTVAPNLNFNIDPNSDTQPRGDGQTALPTITLIGTTSPGAVLTLAGTNLTTTSDANGSFTLTGVALANGDNTLALTSFDPAGNSTPVSIVITRIPPDTTAPSITGVLAADTGISDSDRITSNPTINLTISDPQGISQYTFSVDGGTPAIATPVQGTFSLSLPFANFSQGLHTLTVTATDSFGNVATENFTITFDNQISPPTTFDLAPASDSAPTGDQITTLPTVTLSGTAEPNATITLTQGNLSTTANASGVFQFSDIVLPLGPNTFNLTVADAAGNSANTDLVINRVADITAPTLTAALTNDTGPSGVNSDQLTSDPAIAGTLTDVSGIQTFLAGFDNLPLVNYVDVTVDRQANGSFAFSGARLNQINGGTLSQGQHVLHLIATDIFGNESTFDVVFTLDSAVVPTPSIGLTAASDTGTQGDNITSLGNVTLTGTTEANATVTIQQNGLTTTADGTGAFTFSNVPLVVGNNSFTVLATDAAGNQATFNRIINRVADSSPSIAANLTNDSGASNSDQLTNDASVSGTAADSETSITLFQAGFDSTPTGSYVNIFSELSNGLFSLDSSDIQTINGGSPLSQGAHVLHLIATDTANNSTTFSLAFNFDTILSPSANLDLDIGSDTTPQGDDTTTLPTVTLVGTAEANASITLTGGFATQANALGNFQFANVPLALGNNTLTLTVTDPAGNSAPTDFIFTRDADLDGPSLSATLTGDTGMSNSDGITNNPVVSGTVTDLSGVGFFRAGFNATPVGNYANILPEVQPGGGYSLDLADLNTINNATLNQGLNTLHLIARDIFNNETTRDVVFTFDNQIDFIVAELAPAFQGPQARHTNDAIVTLQGVIEANSTLSLTPGNVTTTADGSGNFSFANIVLNPGNNALTFQGADVAGNEVFAVRTFVLDTVLPVLTAALTSDTGVAGDSVTSNPSVNGSLTDALSDISTFLAGIDGAPVTFNILPALLADGSFSLTTTRMFQINDSPLADGPHTLNLQATDGAGNIQNVSLTFVLDTTVSPNPMIDLALADDTGAVGDRITSVGTVDLVGTGEEGATITLVQGNRTAVVNGGNFTFTDVVLQDGPNTFTIQAADRAGNLSTSIDAVFTLSAGDFDAPVVTVDLTVDSGANGDNITNDPSVSGTVTDATGIATFGVAVDLNAFVNVFGELSGGVFSFDRARLEEINGSPLLDGFHVLYFQTSDGTNTAFSSFSFFLDTVAPTVTDLALAVGSNLNHNTINLVGETEAGALLTLNPGNFTASADGLGAFNFNDVPLAIGNNTLTLVASDLAGNTFGLEQNFVRNDVDLQIVYASDTNATQGQLGLSIPVNYTTDPANGNLDGLGVRLHFDSSKLTLSSVTNILSNSFVAFDVEADAGDFDSDINTNRFITLEWDGPNWPGTASALLFNANFHVPDDFTGSTQLNFSLFSLAAGHAPQGLSFFVTSNVPDPAGSISGTVFFDADADGFRDPNESGMPGMKVFIDNDQNGSQGENEPVAITNGQGQYTFSNVPVGTHVVVQPDIADQGLFVTTPAFNSILNAANVVGTTPSSDAYGFASFSVNGTGDRLNLHLFFDDLVGLAQSLSIRKGSATQNGPPIQLNGVDIDLTPLLAQGNNIYATIEIDPNDFGDLVAGSLYIEIGTDAFPNGEIRGQLGFSSPANSHLVTLVDGSILTGIDFGNSQ